MRDGGRVVLPLAITMAKLEQADPAVWQLFMKCQVQVDILHSGPKWHGPGWGRASLDELQTAQDDLRAALAGLRSALTAIARHEIESWTDVIDDLARWGVIDFRDSKNGPEYREWLLGSEVLEEWQNNR